MRILINAPDTECARVAMSFVQDFIAKRKDEDGDVWGYQVPGFAGHVKLTKAGNFSASCHREPIKISEAA